LEVFMSSESEDAKEKESEDQEDGSPEYILGDVVLDPFMSRRHQMALEKEKGHRNLVENIISEIKVDSSLVVPQYYSGLLSWSLTTHIKEDGWQIVRTEGYEKNKHPIYHRVDVSKSITLTLLFQGVLVLEKDSNVLVVSLDCCPYPPGPARLVVTGPKRIVAVVEGFKDAVEKISVERNFYRGGKISFYGTIDFIDIPDKSWDDLVLDQVTRDRLWDNTVGFLFNRKRLKQYGLPGKRGVLMCGAPGTGKTLACKGIMAASEGITCITTKSEAIEHPAYLEALYELAQDLSPSIVLIEDLDLICQERELSHYMRGSALLELLSVLDGVEECEGVVTIGTTNTKETIDKAISQRPSRFDVIIDFPKPALKQRVDLIAALSRNIPLEVNAQEYLARKTEGHTPAQIQEIMFSLAISYCKKNDGPKPAYIACSMQDLDNAISKIDRDGKAATIGFSIPVNGSAKRCGANAPMNENNEERR
jgi:hypothetical protein